MGRGGNVEPGLASAPLGHQVGRMQAGSLPLTLAPGWKNVPPQATGRHLVWKKDRRWRASDTDFNNPGDLGPCSPIDCPVAYDPTRELIYRYHCAQWGDRRDASELRQIRADGSGDDRLFGLGLNKWALWLCRFLPDRDALAALVATEMPSKADGTVVIQHQLAWFDVAKKQSLLVNLPRDCFYPLDLHPGAKRVLFHGAEGYQVVDFSGRRLYRLGPKGLPEGRGGSFNPNNPDELVLGGGGIMLVRRDATFIRLRDRGVNPVWSPDGQDLFFAESSSDLWHRAADGSIERLLSVAGNRYSEVNRARPVQITRDGRYLALAITRRVRRQAVEGAYTQGESSGWAEIPAVCILDLVEKIAWQTSANGPVCWLE